MSLDKNSYPKKVNVYHPIKSFGYAIEGIVFGLKREPNITLQLFLGLFFGFMGIIYRQWASGMANLILMAVIIAFELLNTAIETLCDLVNPEHHPKVKIIKDTAAGAVLVVALAWLTVIIYQTTQIFFPDILSSF